jgi:alpha-ketoglutarate-dependent taurine dioxygenase
MVTMQPGPAGPALRKVGHGPSFEVRVRGRQFLAGSAHENFPEAIPDAAEMIPVFAADPADRPLPLLAAAVAGVIEESLPASGGVLFRMLPLATRTDFERLVTALGYESFAYRGGIAVRKNDSDVTLAASDEDHRVTLSPHNEMAYLAEYPRKIFFFCESPADEGGEVPVNDIRETKKIIPQHVLETFRSRGIRYQRRLAPTTSPGAMGWPDTFGTGDKGLIEKRLRATNCHYQWDSDELSYHYDRPAFVPHPGTGEELWFNQVTELHCSYWRAHPGFPRDLPAQAYPATTAYGDGTPIDEDQISSLRGALWRTARAVRMRTGDVLVLDNQVLAHGRLAFAGRRRHYVALTR